MSRITLPNIIIGSGTLLLAGGVFIYLGFSPALLQEVAAILPGFQASNDSASAGTKRYINREFGFSFDYPAEYTVYSFWEEPGYTVLLSRPELKQELHIYVQPYDEPQLPAADDIRELLPDLHPGNFEDVTALGKARPAITFERQDAHSRRFYEAWFMRDGLLYQVSTRSATRELLVATLHSWRYLPLLTP